MSKTRISINGPLSRDTTMNVLFDLFQQKEVDSDTGEIVAEGITQTSDSTANVDWSAFDPNVIYQDKAKVSYELVFDAGKNHVIIDVSADDPDLMQGVASAISEALGGHVHESIYGVDGIKEKKWTAQRNTSIDHDQEIAKMADDAVRDIQKTLNQTSGLPVLSEESWTESLKFDIISTLTNDFYAPACQNRNSAPSLT